MAKINNLNFSVASQYLEALERLRQKDESLSLCAKRLLLAHLSKEIKQSDQDNGAIEDSLGDICTRIDTIEDSLGDICTRIDTIEDSLGDICTRIDTIEQSIETIDISEPINDCPSLSEHLSDASVARIMEVVPSTVTRWRLGQRKMSPEVLSKLESLGLGISDKRWVKN